MSNDQTITTAADVLRFLADARAEYDHGDDNDYLSGQINAARTLSAILAGENDARGWLPSWRWDEFAALMASYRPDAEPARTEPTEDRYWCCKNCVADALQVAYSAWERRVNADQDVPETEYEAMAEAVIPLFQSPQRCAPSEEEIEDILLRVWHSGDQESAVSNGLNAVQRLYIAQPTVREAKAEGWDEGYGTGVHDERMAAEADIPEYREPGRVNPYRSEADHGE
jgi:hypothetical protein